MRALNKTASQPILYLIAGLILVISLVTCNGGGSSGGGSSITLPTAPVTITSANAPQVAGAAIDAAFGGSALPVAVQTSVPTSAASAAAAAKTLAKIVQAAAQQIVSQGAATVTGAATTISCPYGGSISLNITSPTSRIVTYHNCSDVAGVTINGTMSLSNIVSTPSSLSTDAVFNLTIATASPANTITAIGDMHLYMDATAITMSGNSLSMGNSDPAIGNFGLQNYSITFNNSGTFTAMTFTFASTAINGTAAFTMTTPFAYGNGLFPVSGAATISGANSTKLKLTVLGDENAPVGSQVKLELSTDGGATYAIPTYHTWAEISSRI